MSFYKTELPEVTELFYKELLPELFYEERTQEFFAGFPHVEKKLTAFWGNKEFRPYVTSLINDTTRINKDGLTYSSRRGFPSNCMLILFKMLELHDEKFPQFKDQVTIWDDLI